MILRFFARLNVNFEFPPKFLIGKENFGIEFPARRQFQNVQMRDSVIELTLRWPVAGERSSYSVSSAEA